MLDSGIGRKGDLVERGHEFRHEDLGQEQRSRIEAEVMRGEPAAGDEDVGLALHEPEERAERHQAAAAREGGRAPEIEARPHPPAPPDRPPHPETGEQPAPPQHPLPHPDTPPPPPPPPTPNPYRSRRSP